MTVYEYAKPAHPPALVRDLIAAGIVPLEVTSDGWATRVVVPEGVAKSAVDPVVAAHDPAAIDAAAAQAETAWRTQDQTERDALAAIDAQWQTYLDTPNNSVTQNMTIVATKNLIRVARWLVKRVRAGRLGD